MRSCMLRKAQGALLPVRAKASAFFETVAIIRNVIRIRPRLLQSLIALRWAPNALDVVQRFLGNPVAGRARLGLQLCLPASASSTVRMPSVQRNGCSMLVSERQSEVVERGAASDRATVGGPP